jgi:hypothetical protein
VNSIVVFFFFLLFYTLIENKTQKMSWILKLEL